MTRYIKLIIPKDLVDEPIIYKMVTLYQVQTNILEARLDAHSVGQVSLEVKGSDENIDNSINYLRGLNIEVIEQPAQ